MTNETLEVRSDGLTAEKQTNIIYSPISNYPSGGSYKEIFTKGAHFDSKDPYYTGFCTRGHPGDDRDPNE